MKAKKKPLRINGNEYKKSRRKRIEEMWIVEFRTGRYARKSSCIRNFPPLHLISLGRGHVTSINTEGRASGCTGLYRFTGLLLINATFTRFKLSTLRGSGDQVSSSVHELCTSKYTHGIISNMCLGVGRQKDTYRKTENISIWKFLLLSRYPFNIDTLE
jgi:hypothetical protein